MKTQAAALLPPVLIPPQTSKAIIFSTINMTPHPKPLLRRSTTITSVSIKPPPEGFDFQSSSLEILGRSRAAIAAEHPCLLDLTETGTLVRIEKDQFGPVPEWRSEFVEPEEIWLVGTTHISRSSALDVERVVRELRPDNVVVELCRSRAGIMYTNTNEEDGEQPGKGQKLKSNMFALTGAEFFGAVGRSINLGGQTALALRLLLAVFSSKISSDVDRPFGDEFRAARKVSEEVGAQIVLGDRPIEITLQRAWKSLNLSQKLNLVVSVVRGITISSPDPSTRYKLEESTTEVGPSDLYKKLSFSYPSLLQPLIHERDTYLAWSLKRSKAVNRSKRVVGVIGKGHLNGVIYSLISDQGDLRFRDLVGKNASWKGGDTGSNSWVDGLVRSLVRDTVIGILLWWVYEQIAPQLTM